MDKKTDAVDLVPGHSVAILDEDYEGKPTDQELATLRRVPGKIPTVAYLLCVVEFCERASYYGKSSQMAKAHCQRGAYRACDIVLIHHLCTPGGPFIGCAQIWTNYINRPLPPGGNGYGAVAPGSQSTQGALGMGEQIAVGHTPVFIFWGICFVYKRRPRLLGNSRR